MREGRQVCEWLTVTSEVARWVDAGELTSLRRMGTGISIARCCACWVCGWLIPTGGERGREGWKQVDVLQQNRERVKG